MNLANQAKSFVCLGILSAIPATAQTNAAVNQAKPTTSPVAYVYVQSSSGVVAYSASSTGQLSKISGSPFHTTGTISGSTGSTFFTVGTDDIHAYPVASNGGIKAQESQIDSQKYSGAVCGTALYGGGVLDHSGKYFYLLLNNFGDCSAYQTYTIGKNGVLTFNNWTEVAAESGSSTGLPTILGNEAFAYTIDYDGHYSNMVGFAREPSGALQAINVQETDPTDPDGSEAYPALVAADPTNHLAVTLDYNASIPPYLASYTADSQGNIVSTNAFDTLPLLPFAATELAMSPSGTFLAVAGGDPSTNDGLEIYHFNGANPITPFSGLMTNMEIDAIKWDTSNHLYALSTKTNQLFVYTVTGTSISKSPGSPYTIKAPTGLVTKSL
jgi:hypothetical protein